MLIAVDTGGTKTLVASFSQAGILEHSRKFATPTSTADYITQLVVAIKDLTNNETAEVISVALPGIVKDGVALWCNHLGWKDFDIRAALAEYFPGTPVLVENDANLAGLAETRSLQTIPDSSLYITISTGIGTGMITGGVIDPGLRLSEGGRIMVEFDGAVREWESFASGSAIYSTYGRFARDITDNATWNHIADRISRGFLVLIPMIQPEVIIVGGSIGTYFERYGDQLIALLKEKLPAHIAVPRCIKAAHPEEAVVYGCYYYALDSLVLN